MAIELPEDEELDEFRDSLPIRAEPGKLKEKPKGGRPRKEYKFQEVREANEDVLALIMDKIIPQALMDLVEGVKVLEYEGKGKDRKEVVYQRPPDIQAIKLIYERLFGKTPSTITYEGQVQHEVTVDLESQFEDDEVTTLLEIALAKRKSLTEGDDSVIVEGEFVERGEAENSEE